MAVPVMEIKPELPLLDWGLPSREMGDAKSGSSVASTAVTANGRGGWAESSLDTVLPEEAPVQNPQVEAGAANGVSDMAFAARMIQSDPPAGTAEAAESGAPASSANASPSVSSDAKASSEDLSGDAVSQVTASNGPAAPADDSQPAVAAIKAALPNPGESRNQNAHTGQSEINSAPGEAAPGGVNRESSFTPASETKQTAAAQPLEPEPPPAPPVSHDVSLRLADGPNNVDIRMSERGGEIRVTVHTPDGNLANAMRSDLPDLVGKLRQNGYQAETWRPAAPPQGDGQRRSGDNPSQQHSPGDRRDGRQQQQQQQQNQPRWVGEWNTSLNPGQESSR